MPAPEDPLSTAHAPLDQQLWLRAVEIFEIATALVPEERDALIISASGDDAELARIVQAMVAADAQSGSLLDRSMEDVAHSVMGEPADHVPDLRPGDQVGTFEIIRELGRGGMGVVYAARDRHLGRTAALKFLPSRAAEDEEHIEQLIAEAKAASALDHPNIATVYQLGETVDGRRFVAMALYDGETLRDRLRRGPLPWRDALGIAEQVAAALAGAHEAGIVHRDVKPANILLTRQGLVKLLDFGVAAMVGDPFSTGARGTVLYISPQQAGGGPPAATDDVWSLGVLLYEMLAGAPPFVGQTRSEVVAQILDSTPAPVLPPAARVPSQLGWVVARALSRSADERFAHGGAVLRELERCGRTSRQRKVVKLAAAGIVFAVGAVVTAATLRDGPALTEPVLAVGAISPGPGGGRPDLLQVLPNLLAERLAQIPTLRVVSAERLSEIRAQLGGGEESPLSVAAEHAGATEMIEGTLLDLTDGRMRLELRRTDLKAGTARGTFSVEGMEPFAMVELAARRVARTMGVMSPEVLGEFPTRSLVAFRFYEEGLRAFYQGDAFAAHRMFAAAFTEDTTFAMALYYDRHAQRWAGLLKPEADTMLPRLEQLARHRPERERLRIRAMWADAAHPVNQLAIAESLATRYPTEVDAHYFLARARVVRGDLLAAIPVLRKVVELDSLSLRGGGTRCLACEALAEIVSVYNGTDSLAAAERTAREWVRLQPDAARAWWYLASTLEYQDRYDEALAARARAMPLQPGNRVDPVYPGMLAIRGGDWNTADAVLLHHARAGPPSVRDYAASFLVVSLRSQGRMREALALARERGFRLLEAIVLTEMGRGREAAPIYDSLARVAPAGYPARYAATAQPRPWMLAHSATARFLAGDTASLGSLAATIDAAARVSSLARGPRLVHYVHGLQWSARGDHHRAEAAFRAATHSGNTRFNRIRYELARTLLALDRPAEAVAVLEPALRGALDGGNYYLNRTEIHALLGRAYEAGGQPARAVPHYQRAVDAWSKADPEWRLRRDSVRARLNALTRSGVARR